MLTDSKEGQQFGAASAHVSFLEGAFVSDRSANVFAETLASHFAAMVKIDTKNRKGDELHRVRPHPQAISHFNYRDSTPRLRLRGHGSHLRHAQHMHAGSVAGHGQMQRCAPQSQTQFPRVGLGLHH